MNGKPITILELGGLPSEVINVVVSVLARLAFDFGLWSSGKVPITFVCEEAHRYVPNDRTLGFEPTKRAISRIAKEGRKYGVSLAIVTQRPAELDPTILSQCNTIFSMRLTNEKDQEILKAGISDAAASLLEFMPTMGTGEAVTFGEGVALPTRVKFDLLPASALPKSTTASFTLNWNREVGDEQFLADIITRWRLQTYNPMAADIAAEVQEEAPAAAAAPAVAAGAGRLRPAAQPAAAPSLRRSTPAETPAAVPGGWTGDARGLQQAAGAQVQRTMARPAVQEASPPPSTQQSLASLIKQYRS